MTNFKFIDLFAGIGGFRIALEAVGGKCVFSSEIDEKAKNTYFDNFDEMPFGDIRLITDQIKYKKSIKNQIPDHDILTAGFPCQPFSLAGVSARNFLNQSHGFDDETQGTLFNDIIKIAVVKRPQVLLLENVSNIVTHDKGRTFSVIRDTIEKRLGYQFFYKIINAENYVAQSRKRCFIVAFRNHVGRFDFPIRECAAIPLKTVLDSEVSSEFTISDKSWAGHQRRTKNNIARGTGFTAYEADLDRPSRTIVARYYKDGKECLVPQKGKNPRFLTPRECSRLFGFPENFILPKTKATAYKQLGNSVAIPVVRDIMLRILNTLNKDTLSTLKKAG